MRIQIILLLLNFPLVLFSQDSDSFEAPDPILEYALSDAEWEALFDWEENAENGNLLPFADWSLDTTLVAKSLEKWHNLKQKEAECSAVQDKSKKYVRCLLEQYSEAFPAPLDSQTGPGDCLTGSSCGPISRSALLCGMLVQKGLASSIGWKQGHISLHWNAEGKTGSEEIGSVENAFEFSPAEEQFFIDFWMAYRIAYSRNSAAKKFAYLNYPDGDYSLRQWTGILYAEAGREAFRSKFPSEAAANFEKALQLFPCERHRNFAMVAHSLVADGHSGTLEQKTRHILRIKELHDFDISPNVRSWWAGLTLEYFESLNDTLDYQNAFRLLQQANFPDEEMSTIRTVYYLRLAEFFAISENYKRSLDWAENAYQEYPNDEDIQDGMVFALLSHLEHDLNNQWGLVYEDLQEYLKKYPALKAEKTIRQIESLSLAMAVYQSFYEDNSQEGERWLSILESRGNSRDWEFPEDPELTPGRLIGEGVRMYIRFKDYDAARDVLERGLKLFPEDESLQKQQSVFQPILYPED